MKSLDDIIAEVEENMPCYVDEDFHAKELIRLVAKAYSLSCQEALREKIAELPLLKEKQEAHKLCPTYWVDRKSIRNTPLIEG